MSYIEPGTWEEQALSCFRIVYSKGSILIVEETKNHHFTLWKDYLKDNDGSYLTSAKFECYADAVHYLRRFLNYEIKEPTLLSLLTSIEEFLSREPFPLTNCLDYLE